VFPTHSVQYITDKNGLSTQQTTGEWVASFGLRGPRPKTGFFVSASSAALLSGLISLASAAHKLVSVVNPQTGGLTFPTEESAARAREVAMREADKTSATTGLSPDAAVYNFTPSAEMKTLSATTAILKKNVIAERADNARIDLARLEYMTLKVRLYYIWYTVWLLLYSPLQ
jgi:hypothetical protein